MSSALRFLAATGAFVLRGFAEVVFSLVLFVVAAAFTVPFFSLALLVLVADFLVAVAVVFLVVTTSLVLVVVALDAAGARFLGGIFLNQGLKGKLTVMRLRNGEMNRVKYPEMILEGRK